MSLQQPYVPQDISDAKLAFPASVVDTLMPAYADIPDDFRGMGSSNKWVKFADHWFFHGLAVDSVKPKKDIDRDKALRHLAAIQGSYEPKHEHKSAAVAYLASLWFKDWKRA